LVSNTKEESYILSDVDDTYNAEFAERGNARTAIIP
jgi:hypothetical protein